MLRVAWYAVAFGQEQSSMIRMFGVIEHLTVVTQIEVALWATDRTTKIKYTPVDRQINGDTGTA